jgi:hypothetical protein
MPAWRASATPPHLPPFALMKMPPAASGPLARGPSLPAVAARAGDWVIAKVLARSGPGTRTAAALRRGLRLPVHSLVAWLFFSLALMDAAYGQYLRGYSEAWLALVAIPVGAFLLRRPVLLGVVMAMAGVYLRALNLSYPETCDQMAVSRAALRIMTGGGNPWGFGYAESVPPGAPFPYGPLAGLTSVLGVPGEVIAMGGILLILAFSRALLTLAFLAAWVAWINLGVCGINDQVPALLLLAGLLLLERRKLSGAVLVAISAGIKPYGFAWFPPLLGYGGAAVTAVLVGVAAVLWLPVVLWGPSSYLTSVDMARSIHPRSENTLDMPGLRILALPVVVASLFVRSWSTAMLSGALIFVIVLFLDHWASFGYWLVVLPIVGIVLERALLLFGARLRAAVRRRSSGTFDSRAGYPAHDDDRVPVGAGPA